MNVSSFVVLTAGLVDVAASTAKFESALSTYIAERETEDSTINAAVNSVFDLHLGKRLPTPVVKNMALQNLNVQPENYTALFDRVGNYLRAQAEAGVLSIMKGKGGGIARVSDLPATEAK